MNRGTFYYNLRSIISPALWFMALVLLSAGVVGAVPQGSSADQHQGTTGDASVLPATRPLTSGIRAYGIELAEVERAYDATLFRALSNFFEPGTFLPDVRLEVQARTTDIHTSTAKEVVRTITSLPGMPYFEQEATAPDRSGTTMSRFFTGMELKRMHITIYADTIYDGARLSFMRQLIIAAAKVEPTRGDRINIISQPFPNDRPHKSTSPTLTEVAKAADAKSMLIKDPTETKKLRIPLNLHEWLLVISSTLLIFVIIYLAISLWKIYA